MAENLKSDAAADIGEYRRLCKGRPLKKLRGTRSAESLRDRARQAWNLPENGRFLSRITNSDGIWQLYCAGSGLCVIFTRRFGRGFVILLASFRCFWHVVKIGQVCCPIFVSGRIAAGGLTSYRFWVYNGLFGRRKAPASYQSGHARSVFHDGFSWFPLRT
ncbi:hypothetical protein [Martelella soudanensis]|uniref:hypothetical protein n=1 Tax=unclassified Martelella TaxID=2629616 RepID=UPI0015DF8351|nr:MULTISPECIES: hypothetical protein [unclassified Martelella]